MCVGWKCYDTHFVDLLPKLQQPSYCKSITPIHLLIDYLSNPRNRENGEMTICIGWPANQFSHTQKSDYSLPNSIIGFKWHQINCQHAIKHLNDNSKWSNDFQNYVELVYFISFFRHRCRIDQYSAMHVICKRQLKCASAKKDLHRFSSWMRLSDS